MRILVSLALMNCEVDDMHVRDGYKITKLGEIPIDWTIKKIEDICPLQRGYDITSENVVSGKYPIVYSNGILRHHNEYKSVGPGVVTGRSGTIGKVSYINENYWPHNTALWVTDFCNNESKFIYFFLCQMHLERFGTGTGVPTLNRNNVHEQLACLPPLSEQQKIADILSTVDEYISETESLIEKTTVLKQGMMQRLLTKGIGHTEFKDTEIGWIPVEWEVVDFGSLCISRSVKYQPTTAAVIKYIALEHLDQGTGRLLSYGSSCDTTSIKTEFHKNDVLFGKLRPYLRKFWLAQFDGVCSTEILVLKSNEKALSSIILYFVEQDSFIEMATGKAYGTKMPRASWEDIKAIQVPQISLLEQQKIASILTAIDDQIDAYQTKLTSLTKLKSALMQQLLTGKKRVKI